MSYKMKVTHENLVDRQVLSGADEQQAFSIKRHNHLLETASASRGRLIARWVAAGVSAELAQSLADDEGVGAPSRLSRDLPQAGLAVLEGDFGSGKSITSERIHSADVAAALDDDNAPLPVYLIAKSVTSPLIDAVRAPADQLGDLRRVGLRLVVDGLDESGPARASELLNEARVLVYTWPNCRIVATTRPGIELTRDEKFTYPSLSDDEATALVERLGGHPSLLWSGSEAIRNTLHLPLFLIIATLQQQAGAEVPRSRGTFFEALADGALRHSHRPPAEARQALKEMACLAIQSSGTVPAAELGSEDTVRSVLETRLVVRTGRVLRFALPVVEQYFAAQAVLEQGTTRLDLHDLRLLERWRYPIMLAVTIGSWRQVTALLDALTHLHPGLSSWSVANALPETASAPTAALPDGLECARRLYHTLTEWKNAHGALGQLLGLTDSTGALRTVGVWVEGSQLMTGLKVGQSAGVDVTQLPYGLHPFTGQAPDGSVWTPLRSGIPPADFMAWPWLWALQWVSRSIESLLRTQSLPLPDTVSFQAERRWAVAKAIAQRTGSIDHRPLVVNSVLTAAERLRSVLVSQSASWYRLNPSSKVIITKDEIERFIEELSAGDIPVEDGMLHRPYPAPDITPGGGHVSSVYSDEALRSLVEQVCANALLIYRDLVNTWFPALAPTLGLACILPVTLRGELLPDGGSWGGPAFVYYTEPLPLSEPTNADVRLVATHGELFDFDSPTRLERRRKNQQLVSVLHPDAEGWANPRAAGTTVWVYGDMPATTQAYRWLWEDLQALRMIKQPPPASGTW